MKTLPLWPRVSMIILAALGMFLYFFTGPVLVQVQEYHAFADQRTLFGIPHAFDVLSNILFFIVGYLGLMEVLKQNLLCTRRSWYWFFMSIILIAPGSAYYHWRPTDETLIWDRLPMSMGFMALYVALLSEHVNLKFEKLLPGALFMGIISVLTWVFTTDLRFYFWVQFSSFVTIPIILVFFGSRFSHKLCFLWTLVLYGLAKWTETRDHEIFRSTKGLVSGHTLKHVLAAAGLMSLWWMIKVRKEKTT